MVFSSLIFLYLFLPVVLICHFFIQSLRLRNWLLLAASLFFYAWGEGDFVLILLLSIVVNFALAAWIKRIQATRRAKVVLSVAIAINLGLLFYYKYANFFIATFAALGHGDIRHALAALPAPLHLPIGISFFTFHELSYLIDIYRGTAKPQKSFVNTALYVTFFPQLVAGPIVRYNQIAAQITERRVTLDGFSEGIRRFIVGMGKKMLIANAAAGPADKIFAISIANLTTPLAWFGTLCYALQIYFDFSGYSDMAIGLALMFGFRFPENFNYPYIARSITEFWRRWHISLSQWFRDYLYIPLGGNRVSRARTYVNLLIVFFLCGLWHGASWTFVVWGLFHGFFLILERMGFSKRLESCWSPLTHLYVLSIIFISWVLFRADTLTQAFGFFKAMVGLSAHSSREYHAGLYLNTEVKALLLVGIIGSTPILPWLQRRIERLISMWRTPFGDVVYACGALACLGLTLLASALQIAAGTYSPFIYFRF